MNSRSSLVLFLRYGAGIIYLLFVTGFGAHRIKADDRAASEAIDSSWPYYGSYAVDGHQNRWCQYEWPGKII